MVTILKQPSNINFSAKPTYVRLSTDYTAANAPEGLKGMLQVETLQNDILDIHQTRYNTNRQTAVDISSAFSELMPPLPPDNTIGVASSAFSFIDAAHTVFRIRAWDKYDTAPYEDAATIQSEFHGLYGDQEADFLLNYNTNLHICHRYPKGYRKKVTPKQPDYIFILAPTPWGDCSIEVTVFMNNGSSFLFKAFEHVEVPSNRLLAFATGFTQLNIWEQIKLRYPDAQHFPTAYQVAVFSNDIVIPGGQFGNDTRYMLCEKSYVIENRVPEETVYIAWENGFGGIETQYFPIYQKRREAEKETIELMLFDESTAREGSHTETQITWADRYTLKSLVLPRPDLEMMQRICHAPIWQIANGQYRRIYVDSKTVDAPPSNQTSGHFTFSFKYFNN